MVSLHGAFLRTVKVFSGLREIVLFWKCAQLLYVCFRLSAFAMECTMMTRDLHVEVKVPQRWEQRDKLLLMLAYFFFHTFTKLQSESREFSLSLFLCNSVIRWYMAGYISYTQQCTRRPMITRQQPLLETQKALIFLSSHLIFARIR